MANRRLPLDRVLSRLVRWSAVAAVPLVVASALVLVRSDGIEGSLFEFSMSRLGVSRQPDPPTVLLIGDTGSASPEFRANVRAMEHESALMAVHTGDVSYHGPKEYPRFLDAVDDLPFPLFAVPGDHDRDWDPSLSEYDALIGGRDRVVNVDDLRLILLDTSTETVSHESFLFLEAALAKVPKPKWTIVATHCPPFEPGRAPGSGHAIRSEDQSQRLLSMLEAAEVDLLACGHIHGFRNVSSAAVPIVITGGGGRSVEPGDSFHYVRVTLGEPIGITEVVTSGPRGRDPLGRLLDSAIALLLWNGKVLSIVAGGLVALLVVLRWRDSLVKAIFNVIAPSKSRAIEPLPMSRRAAAIWRVRHVAACAPLGFALVSTRWEWEYDPGIWTIAGLLSLAGIAVRSSALRYGNPTVSIMHGSLPVGLYSRIRQPLYLGGLFLIAASVVASELVWFLPIAIGWAIVVYEWASRWEEEILTDLCGDGFCRYRKAVPKWIPRFSGASQAEILMAAPLREVFVEQLPLAFVLLPFVLKELNVFGFWPIH